MSKWFTTDKPLPDGWYWWRYEKDSFEEICLVLNKKFLNHGSERDDFENWDNDFSGYWQGPIEPDD